MPPHHTSSPEATQQLAAKLAPTLTVGTVLVLTGPVGAGKTCFVQGLAQGLGVPSHIAVNSPTYILLNIYAGRLPLYHFDWYRLERPEALHALDLDEYLEGNGICVIEWGDKFPQLLPPHTRTIRFEIVSPSKRRIEMGE